MEKTNMEKAFKRFATKYMVGDDLLLFHNTSLGKQIKAESDPQGNITFSEEKW